MNYKIIGKYIKELNFNIPNPKIFFLLTKDIANYKINIDIKSNQFEKKIVEVEAGSALLIHSSLIHGSIKTKKKRFARFILCDRLCPLVKLPYLREEKAPIKIPYVGVDYNTIVD